MKNLDRPKKDELSERIGLPFAIRATAKKYKRDDVSIPSGLSDFEGLGFSPRNKGVIHSFLCDEQFFLEENRNPSLVIINSIRMAVGEYALRHAAESSPLCLTKEHLPILYLIRLLVNRERMPRDPRDTNPFERYYGFPTLPECTISSTSVVSDKSHTFEIEESEYNELVNEAIGIMKANPCTFNFGYSQRISDHNRTENSVQSNHSLFSSMHDLQTKFVEMGLFEKPLFILPNMEELNKLRADKQQFDELYRNSSKVNSWRNYFIEVLYSVVYVRRIIEKMHKKLYLASYPELLDILINTSRI